ncbi:CocE/NonD family hydrolase, partial [Nocardioides sp.]|uniref:CocE/NonD family hydrolase n=1 Tax=Nocardioides sp. TaxID=35761 RepID=UPI0031FEE734|nr:CocE/NonD family hydrolase [Nocardioides sp.]
GRREPGAVREVAIDLAATSNLFRAGHRIRLEISSSNFPRFDRNTNTGGDIATDGYEDLVVATNRIYHDAARPSHVVLPLIER